MRTIFQINVTSNWGSHGKIAEDIGRLAIEKGWRSVIAYGRYATPSQSETIKIGSDISVKEHVLESRLMDNHGLASRSATRRLIKQIDDIKPDIIHLHNIHGYYLNYPLLFDYLKSAGVPVVWTLHDCWPFTGHCAYFDYAKCEKWEIGCCAPCPCKNEYPKTILFEATKRNYQLKKEIFNTIDNLTLVPVSDWLGGLLQESFLKKHPVHVIKNGIDINVFKPTDSVDVRKKYGIDEQPYLIGVASVWEKRKGFDDFLKLAKEMPQGMRMVLVGLDKEKLSTANQNGIVGIPRTENVGELTALYSGAEMFLNLTYEDNYPTTNLEAMACGTPVLTYRTGGSPEAVSSETGWVVEKDDLKAVKDIIISLPQKNETMRVACRKRAEEIFDKNKCFEEYMKLYESLIQES